MATHGMKNTSVSRFGTVLGFCTTPR